MRQSSSTETQIVAILKEAEAGRPVNEIWRQYGISSATYYKWKAKYGAHYESPGGCPVPRGDHCPYRKASAHMSYQD